MQIVEDKSRQKEKKRVTFIYRVWSYFKNNTRGGALPRKLFPLSTRIPRDTGGVTNSGRFDKKVQIYVCRWDASRSIVGQCVS